MFVEQRAYEGASYITSLSYQPSTVYQTLCLMALDPPSHSLIHHSVFLALVQPQAMPLALPLCPELKAHRGVLKDPDSCVSPAPPYPTHPGPLIPKRVQLLTLTLGAWLGKSPRGASEEHAPGPVCHSWS